METRSNLINHNQPDDKQDVGQIKFEIIAFINDDDGEKMYTIISLVDSWCILFYFGGLRR